MVGGSGSQGSENPWSFVKMGRWSLWLALLMAALSQQSASAAAAQARPPASPLEQLIFVRFDDIVTPVGPASPVGPVGQATERRLAKRETDDFSIDDDELLSISEPDVNKAEVDSLPDASSQTIPPVASEEVTSSTSVASEGVIESRDLTPQAQAQAKETTASSVEEINSSEQEETSDIANEIEDSTETKEKVGEINTDKFTKDLGSEEAADDEISSPEAVIDEFSKESVKDASADNMEVEIISTFSKIKDSPVLGNLKEAEEGSGDEDSESESAEVDNPKESNPIIEEALLSKNISDSSNGLIVGNKLENEVVETTTIDISVKERKETEEEEGEEEESEDLVTIPDERPIPNPIDQSSEEEEEEEVTEKPTTTLDSFKVDELIKVTAIPALTDELEGSASSSEEEFESATADGQPGLDQRNATVSEKEAETNEGNEEKESTTEKTEDPMVPVVPIVPVGPLDTNSTEPPSKAGTETDADDNGEENGDTELKKLILTKGLENNKEKGINEIGVQKQDETLTDEPAEKRPSSSSGSFIVLGAIMVTIVALLAYTVVKSRRQKRKRRSIELVKAAEEDQGREMKEVDKLLSPQTLDFGRSNGGPKKDDRLRQGNWDADREPEEFTILLNGGTGGMEETNKEADQLSDVIVENVPRLTSAPMANGSGSGSAPSENGTDDDQGSWVFGSGNAALESTKIKMYIDEDSIPKTPIVIVNRGPTPNEM